MFHYYKLALLLVTLIIPFVAFVKGNRFNSMTRSLLRALLAMVLVWVWILAMRLIVVKVDVALAQTPEQLKDIYDGDGPKNAAALLFGWVPGVVLVAIYWATARVTLILRSRNDQRHVA
jgi:hypothetical protein